MGMESEVQHSIAPSYLPELDKSKGYYRGTPCAPEFILPGDYDPAQLPGFCPLLWKYIEPEPSTITLPPPLLPLAFAATQAKKRNPRKKEAPKNLEITESEFQQLIHDHEYKKEAPKDHRRKRKKTVPVTNQQFSEFVTRLETQKPFEFLECDEKQCKQLMLQKDRNTERSRLWREARKTQQEY
jgi:hypothetical protein